MNLNNNNNNNHKHNCGGGCSNKEKPSDCGGNGCGRCCKSEKKSVYDIYEQELILELLERYFLPIVYLDKNNILIYKNNENTTIDEIKINSEIIKKLEENKLLVIDFDVELDEYSYGDYTNLDYKNFIIENNNYNVELKRGSISITDKCFNQFLKKG